MNSWIVLLPPLLVLACAAATHRVISSLLLGIFSASIITNNYVIGTTIWHILTSLQEAIIGHWALFIFLAILGTLIEMMTHAGGITAYTNFLRRFVTTPRSAETASLMLSCTFFLDDYLNGLVTGAIMRPLTDVFRIPRIKLAFLINAMSSPLCLLIPATTWVALILGLFQAAGISDEAAAATKTIIAADPMLTYFSVFPFIFYPFLILFSAWFIVRNRLSFGLMKEHEDIARTTGNLFGGKQEIFTGTTMPTEGSMLSFVVPIATFVILLFGSIIYTGQHWLFGGTNGFIGMLSTANIILCLLFASACATTALCLLLAFQHKFSSSILSRATLQGISLMKNSLIVLTLAFTLGIILDKNLHTGTYLAQIISSALPVWILPLLVFMLAAIMTAATGSSWGTITILMPLCINTLVGLSGTATLPLSIAAIPTFLPTIGGLLSGSVAGAHISPITDATVVAATSARAHHIDHVKTMIAYSTPAIIGTCCALLITGITYTWPLWMSYAVAMTVAMGTTTTILLARNKAAHAGK